MKNANPTFRSSISAMVLGLALGLSTALPAHADDDIQEARQIARMASLIDPDRAMEIALREKPGVMTDLDLDRERKGWAYEIEVVDAQGVEWEVELEAETGKVLKIKRDWF
jgi:uncharacterized membrane protein YkoI